MSSNNKKQQQQRQQQKIRRDDVKNDTGDGSILQGDDDLTTDPAPTEDSRPPDWIPFASNPLFSPNKVVVPLQKPPALAIKPTVKDQAHSLKAPATPAHQQPTRNTKDEGPDNKAQVHPLKKEPMKQESILPPDDTDVDDSPPPPVGARGSNPQPSTNMDKKMAPRGQLKRPPVQAMIAGGHLPTVKDQASSFTAPATRGATRQPAENAGYSIPVDTADSTKDRGPDYKDQVRFVQPPPPQVASTEGVAANNDGPDYKDQVRNVQPPEPQLASAVGVPVSSSNTEEPSTVIALVMETFGASAAAAAPAAAAVEEEPQQLAEDHEPPENGRPVRKHLIWAVTVLVVVAVVAGVVVALNSNGTRGSPPTTAPPAFAQETKLTASDGAQFDEFGWSVAAANDTIVVGAYGDDTVNGEDSGSIYIFTHTGTTWTEQAKLMASDGASFKNFGNIVAIAGDTIVVGANKDNANGQNSGSAYVFTGSGATWTQQAKLTASDGAPSYLFGRSVSILGDTIVVGANGASGGSGSAYVFTRTGTSWSEQAKLTASDGADGDRFGVSVAIAGDTIVVGAHWDDDNGADSGSAYVFTSTGTTWTQQAKLTASDGAEDDQFGFSVAIAGDTIVVGARLDGDNGSFSGSVYVFTGTGTAWTQQAKLTASDGAEIDYFGISVGIEGDTIVVGASADIDVGMGIGSAYVYMQTGTTWTEQAKLTATDMGNFGDWFGESVAIAGDTIVVGARGDNDVGDDSGSVYIYDLN